MSKKPRSNFSISVLAELKRKIMKKIEGVFFKLSQSFWSQYDGGRVKKLKKMRINIKVGTILALY